MKIISEQFPDNQYVKEFSKKSQIVIHHTVSGPGINGDVAWWKSTPERIATHFIIDREGIIHQFFSTDYWGYHLGLKTSVFKKFGLKYKNLDSSSISIELDSWGPLTSEMCPVGNPNSTVPTLPRNSIVFLLQPLRGNKVCSRRTAVGRRVCRVIVSYQYIAPPERFSSNVEHLTSNIFFICSFANFILSLPFNSLE